MQKKVLVLGGSGRFGRNMAEAFRQAGWRVRLFDREKDDLMQAARGMDVIVNGWNPSYQNWQAEVPNQTAQIIAAARASGATVLVPGNIYVFGRNMPQVLNEHTPQRAENSLGIVRREMEAAYRDSDVPTILLRAGDFIDTQESGNWFDRVLTARLSKGVFTYMGAWDKPHSWAYLPDLARAGVALVEKRDTLQRFEDVPFPGYTLTGTELAQALEQATGRSLRRKSYNWNLFHVLALFWPLIRYVKEMRYLWDRPHSIDNARLKELLPDFVDTPVVDALRVAIARESTAGVQPKSKSATQA